VTREFPQPGQVFECHYLWHWQKLQGETAGRKKRPCCVTLVAAQKNGEHVMFVAAITSKEPDETRVAVEIPETEARRAGLDVAIPLWVIVDELNVDVLERPYTLEDRRPRGQFSAAFTNMLILKAQEVRKQDGMSLSNRS
jgi:hypothetical protein